MTQIINAYDFVIVSLDKHNKRFEVRRSLIRALLSTKLGITSERKIETHIHNMIELGYITKGDLGSGYGDDRTYDLVGTKLIEVIKDMNRREAEMDGKPRFFD
jgi:hypothetical protein